MNRFNPPRRIVPPSNFHAASSLAAASSRMGEGLGGIYVKTDYKMLAMPSGDTSSRMTMPDITTRTNKSGSLITDYLLEFSGMTLQSGIFLNSEIECPSSRIRVAFGINTFFAVDSPTYFASLGGYAFANVVPGVKIKQVTPIGIPGQPGSDVSEVISGQPIFPYASLPVAGPEIFDPNDYLIGGYDGTDTHSGGVATPNGIGFPFSFEDEAAATVYRLRAGVFSEFAGGTTGFTGPIYSWARWEIIDPRSKEDSETLLSECRLSAPPTQIFAPI